MCVLEAQGGTGFRDIHYFNIASLAKQTWRLIQEPESLCAKVLRADYFPSGDLLNTKIKQGSSFTWQSIWAGLQTLKKGHTQRVADGASIDIWDDEGLPSSHSRRVLTPK
jgi:hypothetical protein